MITEEQDNNLLYLADASRHNYQWREFSEYCSYRIKGLRKEAFEHLSVFLAEAKGWRFEHRVQFVSFLFHLFEKVGDINAGTLPQPLDEELVKPTLLEWCEKETEDSRPFRWYGRFYGEESYLFKALELKPKDDLAREAIIARWINRLYFSVHHLPEYYIGEPEDGLALSAKIVEHIGLLADEIERNCWMLGLKLYTELIESYISWKASGHPDFEKWGAENGKKTGLGTTTYYYTE